MLDLEKSRWIFLTIFLVSRVGAEHNVELAKLKLPAWGCQQIALNQIRKQEIENDCFGNTVRLFELNQ